MSDNPYAPPSTVADPDAVTDSASDELAGRFTRFAAAMVDGILMMAILMPVQFATGYLQRATTQQVGILEQIVMSLLGMAVMLVLSGNSWDNCSTMLMLKSC